MKEIQEFLAKIYLKAGIHISLDEDGEILTDFDKNILHNIFQLLMELREKNYKQYLSCLSVLIFHGYSCLEADSEYIEKTMDSNEGKIPNEENEERVNDRNALIEYIENSKSIEDLDSTLEQNNELNLITLLLEWHVGDVFECSYEYICYDIMMDIEPMPLFYKLVSPQIIQETFKNAVDYATKHDPSEILNLIESFYLLSDSTDSAYDLHKYIINCFLNGNHIEQLAIYIKDILWSAYIRCKYQEDDENVSDEIESYIYNYENNSNFRQQECFNLISKPDTSNTLKLFLDFNKLDYAPTKDLDSKRLNIFSKEMTAETNKFVRKLIPPKEKSE